jgi:hypothetical protein
MTYRSRGDEKCNCNLVENLEGKRKLVDNIAIHMKNNLHVFKKL